MNVLVTNDDGIDSPLLHALVVALKSEPWVTNVLPVVPFCEKSWVAGAVSRHGTRHLRLRSRAESDYLVLDGTPSDCAAIGIGNLYKNKIDLVVSGINFGVNAGVAFHNSSGTVAGARQAALFGVPGVALSAAISSELMNLWKERNFKELLIIAPLFEKIARYQVDVIRKLLDLNILVVNIGNDDLNEKMERGFEFASLNAPVNFSEKPPIVCKLSNTRFNPIFLEERENVFRHKFQGFACGDDTPLDLNNPEDIMVLRAGRSSLTLFNLAAEAQGEMHKDKERFRSYQDMLENSYITS